MKITRSTQSDTNVTLKIESSASELKAAKSLALTNMSSQVKVQGFRPGNAPLELVEKQISPNTLQQETLNEAVNRLYVSALQKEDLRPVANPSIELKKYVPYTDLEFEVHLQIIGEVKLGDYKKLKTAKEKPVADAKDVNEVLERLRLQSADYKELDRASKDGDRVWIDFDGKDSKGEPVQGAKGENYPLVLGSNTFIPGFEENIVGLKKDETKDFKITFPKDYGVKALQSKKVTFDIKVNKVEEVILPKLDTEFAKKVGKFSSIDELKKDIKKQLLQEREHQADIQYQDSLIKELVQKSSVALPDALVDEQVEALDKEFRQNLVYRGQTFKEYLEQSGQDESAYKDKELKPLAVDRIKAGIILGEVAEKEKITVTPEETEVRMEILKDRHQKDGQMSTELEKPEARRDVISRLLTEKTISKLVELNSKK